MRLPADMGTKARWYMGAYRLGRLGRFLLLLLGLWMLGAFIIFLAERPGLGPGARFSSYTDCLWCSTVYLVSGLDEMAPGTVLARVITVFMMIVPAGVLVMFGTSLVATFTEQLQRSSKIRLAPPGSHFASHVVLCGWGPRGDSIIRQLHSSQFRESGTWRTVLIVDPSAGDVEVSDRAAYRDVWGIEGDPVRDEVLREAASLGSAHSAIVCASETTDVALSGIRSDARSILVVLAARASAPDVHLATEVMVRRNLVHFQRSRSQEQICVRDVGAKLIAHAARNHRMTELFLDLLEVAPNSNEVYLLPVPEAFVGLSFTEVQRALSRREDDPVILLGVRGKCGEGQNREMAVNPERRRVGRNDEALPPDSCIPGRVLGEGDELLLLARAEPRLNELAALLQRRSRKER